MISALAEAGAVLERERLPRRRDDVRRVPARRAPRRRRPAAAHATDRGVPRRPRLPARGADHAVRGDVRPALVPRGGRARRHDDRALRRPRARRLLHHRRRPASGWRPAQGPRGLADPVGQLVGRVRSAAPRAAVRRGGLRAPRARGAAAAVRRSPARHPQAFGHLLAALDFYLAPVREVAIVGDRRRASWCAWSAARTARTWCSPAASDGVPLLEGRDPDRRARRRLRVRALRLPGAGDDGRGARGRARGSAIHGAARVRPSGQSPYRTGR